MDYPYSLEDYLDSVKEYMYKHNLVRPHVIAHSFGARIAILGASLDQNLFGKIVLTGAAGLKPKFSIKKAVKKTLFNTLKLVVNKQRLKGFYSKDYQSLSPIMQKSFIKIVNHHLDDRLKYVKNQTLILHGKKDTQTPPYMAKRLNLGIKNSKLVFLEKAGHFAFIDCPIKFNWEVKEFLLQ